MPLDEDSTKDGYQAIYLARKMYSKNLPIALLSGAPGKYRHFGKYTGVDKIFGKHEIAQLMVWIKEQLALKYI